MDSPTDNTLGHTLADGKKSAAAFRIPPEGAAILKKFFYEDGVTHPSKEMREDLLRRIQALPGCETYGMNKLQNWFNHNRRMLGMPRWKVTAAYSYLHHLGKRRESGGNDVPDDPSDPPLTLKIKIPKKSSRNSKLKLTYYPSIKSTALGQLATLVRESPYPSQQLMSTWAQLLKADEKDVEAWVKAEQSRFGGDLMETNIPGDETEDEDDEEALSAIYNTSLPLPSSSGFPTPQLHSVSHTGFHSPISATIPSTSSLFAPLQLHNPPPPPPPPPSEQLLLAIDSKLNSLVGATPRPTEHPRSASEFTTLFKSYQPEMENVLSVVENTEKVKKGKKRTLEMWGFPLQGLRSE